MKKKQIKNRKIELRNKRFFLLSCIFGSILICCSAILSYILFLAPHPYISPLVLEKLISYIDAKSINIKPIIEQTLQEKKIDYVSIQQTDNTSYTVQLNSDEQVMLSANKDILSQVASLQLITSRLTMEGKRFSRLDLRYDKPIVVF